jgi:hypothetical protein
MKTLTYYKEAAVDLRECISAAREREHSPELLRELIQALRFAKKRERDLELSIFKKGE